VIKHLPDGRHILKIQPKTLQIQNGRMLYEYETNFPMLWVTIGAALFISLLDRPRWFTLSKAFDKFKAHISYCDATFSEGAYRLPNSLDGMGASR